MDSASQKSNFFLYLVHIDHDAKPKDFFPQQLWGGLPQRTSSSPLMEYLKDSFDTGQIEDGSSYSHPDLNTMKVATIYLLNGILGRNLCNLHSSGRKTQVSSLPNKGERQNFHNKTGFIPITSGPRRNEYL